MHAAMGRHGVGWAGAEEPFPSRGRARVPAAAVAAGALPVGGVAVLLHAGATRSSTWPAHRPACCGVGGGMLSSASSVGHREAPASAPLVQQRHASDLGLLAARTPLWLVHLSPVRHANEAATGEGSGCFNSPAERLGEARVVSQHGIVRHKTGPERGRSDGATSRHGRVIDGACRSCAVLEHSRDSFNQSPHWVRISFALRGRSSGGRSSWRADRRDARATSRMGGSCAVSGNAGCWSGLRGDPGARHGDGPPRRQADGSGAVTLLDAARRRMGRAAALHGEVHR